MPQLRIGFLAHDWTRVEPWVHRLVAQTKAEENIDIAALIKTPKMHKGDAVNWLFRLINPVEQKIFGKPIPADASHLRQVLENISVTELADDDTILSLDLDVIICLEPNVANTKLARFARHGIWFLDIFDQGALPAVTGKQAVAAIDLNRFCELSSNEETIATARINPKFLMSRNSLFMKEKAVVLVLRELRRLTRSGVVGNTEDTKKIDKKIPGTGAAIMYVGNVVWQLLSRALAEARRRTGIRPDKYILMTGKGNALDFDPLTAAKIVPQGNCFWADPFLWERDGRMYCFYEYFGRPENVGRIQVGEIKDDRMTVIGDALKTSIHLSYPFLFEDGGELYMMPETCAAKRIEIWRCKEFPLQWELHSTALEGESVADSMILRKDGNWWLFTSIAKDVYCDNCSELHIFQIDGPDLKSVIPHSGNPVVMNSRTARSAGRFHEIDGRIYRPSQDNAYGQYGYGLNIMEVQKLNLDEYAETLVRRIDPKLEKTLSGCHHFDAKGERFIIDALKTS